MKKQTGIWLAAALCSTLFQPAVAQDMQQGTSATDAAKSPDAAARAMGITIGNSLLPAKRKVAGHYAVFEKTDGTWKVLSIDTAPQPVADFATREILFFSGDLSYVEPDFRDGNINQKSKQFECWTGALQTSKSQHRTVYNPCDSSLTSTVDARLGTQAMLTVFSLGTNLLTGTTMRDVAVDQTKVLALLQQTNVLGQLKEQKEAKERQAYQDAFTNARTATALNAFIQRYSNNDPDGLVPKATEKLTQASLNDYRMAFDAAQSSAALNTFIQRYQTNDPDKLVPKAIERRDLALVSERQAAEQQRQSNAREAERMQKLQADERRRLATALQAPGTKICASYQGTREEYAGAMLFGHIPLTDKIPGSYTVIGFTEGISGNRLQIRTGSIRHINRSGNFVMMNSLTISEIGVTVQPGTVFWDNMSNWTPC